MALSTVVSESSDRLTEAALLLVDAAREVSREGPAYRPGEPNTAAVIGLAVQAVAMADVWTRSGATLTTSHGDWRDRVGGIAQALGFIIGCVPKREAQTQLLADAMPQILDAISARARADQASKP